MARGISSIVTTAVVAGAIGFGAGVYFVQRRNQISRGDRSLAPMRNAILATRRVVVDSLSVPQLHKVSLIVMLPPRAVRRLNTKTINHHMHRTPVLLQLCRPTAHQTSKVSPLRLSDRKSVV